MAVAFRARRMVLAALAATSIVVAASLAWIAAMQIGLANTRDRLDRDIGLLTQSVSSEIERFRYLPSVVAKDSRVGAALMADKDALEPLNLYLAEVREDSGVDEVYILDRSGLTVAASNFAEPSSFVGHNYRFRPYFREAIATGAGRFYAVGVTTGEPGYFLSSIIERAGVAVGVAVVKVDLAGLEEAWSMIPRLTALSDHAGVVFLTGNPDWKYKPLFPLSQASLAAIEASRKYDGVDIAATSALLRGAGLSTTDVRQIDLGEGLGEHMLRSALIEPEGWRLWVSSNLAPVRVTAALTALSIALASLLCWIGGLYLRQRRLYIRARLEQGSLLEQRVIERTVELNREVDDRRRAEQELREAQDSLIQTTKLAALGRMSAAIVHEISQPLAAMENTLATTGLLSQRGDAGAVAAKLREARGLVRRIQRTIKALKSFARNKAGPRELVDVDVSVANAVELALHRIKAEGVTLSVERLDEPGHVRGNSIRLEQVLLNLLTNALDALRDRPSPRLRVWTERAGGLVAIRVEDNGVGIDDTVRHRVSEPFFTTKVTGEGLGLGLSISRAIVADAGGTLDFISTPGVGTTFTVSLPAAVAAIREAAE